MALAGAKIFHLLNIPFQQYHLDCACTAKQNPSSPKWRCSFTSQHPLRGQGWHHAIGELLQQHLVEHHKVVVSSVHWALEPLQVTQGGKSMHSSHSSTSTIFFFLHCQYNFFTSSKPDCKLVWAIQLLTPIFVINPFCFHCHTTAFVQSSGFKQVNLQIILQSSVRCSMLHRHKPGRPSATALKVNAHNWSA